MVSQWDMLVIPGDLLDHILHFNDHEKIRWIMLFGHTLLSMCKKHDITLRVLEGTPAHDRKQSKYLEHLMMLFDSVEGLDFKYVEELSIEYIEKFNIHILYVPDEWNHDVYVTYNDAFNLMNQYGLQQVDFCFLHGAFNYQIDKSLNPKAHSEDLWSSLVKYYLFAGHVHYRSQYKNIIVPGSFDRLAHGEEDDKGWVECILHNEQEHELIFHVNQNAAKYITLDVRNQSTEAIIEQVDNLVATLPERSYIRLYVHSRDEIKDGLETIKKRHHAYNFSLKVDEGKKQKEKKHLQLVVNEFKAIDLTKENLPRLIEERLSGLSQEELQRVLTYLPKHL